MTTWILLRGLSRESGHWGPFIGRFERGLADARVIAIDLPGNGALHQRDSPTRVEAMAEHCRATLASLGVAPPYSLLAMSLGAMVAVAWANAHPQELARCVLINTSLRPFSPFCRRLRPASYLPLLSVALSGGKAREQEEIILRLTSRLRCGAAEVLDDWVALRKVHPVSRRNAVRQLWAAARYRAPAARPATALLLLASRRDGLVHLGCSEALAAAWGCELRIHPGAGHDLPLDDGPWVVAQVRHWIDGAARRERW